ncbi:MAG TPA: hypothetical protein VEJ37_05985 [Xanthobacteraceae bacterium]|nr:hypothetical protein [Xanthobacteraceae bacterium]
MSRISGALVGTGGMVVILAIGWWWITYGEVIGYGYLSWPEAGRCLLQNSDVCSLAKALCLGSHPRVLIAYWTSFFWFGLILFSASLLTIRPKKDSR